MLPLLTLSCFYNTPHPIRRTLYLQRHISWPLAQVMAWWRQAKNHYLNQFCQKKINQQKGKKITLYPSGPFTNMVNKVRDATIYPFPNLNGCTVEVREWTNNLISHFIMDLNYLFILVLKLNNVSKSPHTPSSPHPRACVVVAVVAYDISHELISKLTNFFIFS